MYTNILQGDVSTGPPQKVSTYKAGLQLHTVTVLDIKLKDRRAKQNRKPRAFLDLQHHLFSPLSVFSTF